jgi:glycosyltransferase involved in cell wall biosynthesis
MKAPLISIVCTNYNKGDWIADAIESFLSQKGDISYEIILIDDKSIDHSASVIKNYAQKYPDIIRAFYNKKNLGIIKTWIKACKEARGAYIARCDGDDYWTDEHKLQKQIALLRKNRESQWCSTDYDIITPSGEVTDTSAFETGLVDRSKSYAEMLATKGFTMSSTWLVDAELMRTVNEEIDNDAVDDTFNIQLELFQRTKLTYLPEATVVYRINEGSDSRPIGIEAIRSRHERLLHTQLEYIDKYRDSEYEEIIKILLRRNFETEMLATERLKHINNLNEHIKSLDKRIVELEQVLHDIRKSRTYRWMVRSVAFIRAGIAFPKRAVRRLLWLDGYRRYTRFYEENVRPTASQLSREAKEAKKFTYTPLISIVVPTYNTDPVFFREMLESVKCQTYPNWELILIDDASPDKTVRTLSQEAAAEDSRVIHKALKKNRHIAGATNEGFAIAKGEYVSLLDHDDILHPSALFEIVKLLNENREIC